MVIDYEPNLILLALKIRRYRLKTSTLYSYAKSKFLEYMNKSPSVITKDSTKTYLISIYNNIHFFSSKSLQLQAIKSYHEIVRKNKMSFYETHLIEKGITLNYLQLITKNSSMSINSDSISQITIRKPLQTQKAKCSI